MHDIFWWARHIILALLSCIFLLLGIHTLIVSYRLGDPFSFVMTFFAASFIILISATLLLGFIWRMVIAGRASNDPEDLQP
ncbi:MAG: hypothetical protein GY864_07830 [Desulfobacterales bacterium]|nr:hypothetical protein [Desulfobacterales bacterium]